MIFTGHQTLNFIVKLNLNCTWLFYGHSNRILDLQVQFIIILYGIRARMMKMSIQLNVNHNRYQRNTSLTGAQNVTLP